MKLIRTWGGENEEDENKFFVYPTDIVISSGGIVNIADSHNHRVNVFDLSGKYMRTVDRRGRGPGDLYGHDFIIFSPIGDLVVYQKGG